MNDDDARVLNTQDKMYINTALIEMQCTSVVRDLKAYHFQLAREHIKMLRESLDKAEKLMQTIEQEENAKWHGSNVLC